MVRGHFALAVGTYALVAVTGCGGDSKHSAADDDAGTGGTGATGGTSATGGSTSTGGTGGSPPLTPAAAAFKLSLQPGSLSSRRCPGSFTFSIGEPRPGGTIADRDGDTGVTCTVTPGGVVHAVIGGADTKTRETVGISVDAVVTRDASTVSAVSFFSLQTLTLQTLAGFPGCTVGTVTVAKAGAVLFDLDCPVLASPDNDTTACAAQGTVAFEYCATEE